MGRYLGHGAGMCTNNFYSDRWGQVSGPHGSDDPEQGEQNFLCHNHPHLHVLVHVGLHAEGPGIRPVQGVWVDHRPSTKLWSFNSLYLPIMEKLVV